MNRAPLHNLARMATATTILISGLVFAGPAYADPRPEAPSGFLLPLPVEEGQASSADRANSNDAVSVDNPETVDQAIALLRQTEEAQKVADAIVNTLANAQVELSAAVALEGMAIAAAEDARGPVAETTERVGVLAAKTYMSGGASDWAALLSAETPQDAIEVATFNAYMSSVSNTYIADADRAKAVAENADDYASQATQKRMDAEARVADLENNLSNAQLVITRSIAAYQAYISAPGPQTRVGSDGCPIEAPSNSLRDGSDEIGITELCRRAVADAPSTQAALAIKTAFSRLGAPYACEGVGRLGAWRFDCSSLVSRSYSDSSGIPVAGAGWAPTTRNMMPWDGVDLDPHYVEVSEKEVRAGDLLLYRSCSTPPCDYQHVVMALTDGYILHTNDCGDIAHIELGQGYGPGSDFVVARRVVHIEGESLLTPTVTFPGDTVDRSTFLTKRQFEELKERQAGLNLEDDEADGNNNE